ncbi:MAG: DUF885 domain-containing protein, partial [Gammaproteobacteria bacterium]|nr:DUF885 domain-containing protein [Gammaproteobacteria bacterium]
MKVSFLAALAAFLVVSGCGRDSGDASPGEGAAVPDAGEALAQLFEEHFERHLELNPLTATRIGDDRYNDRLAISNSPEYREAERKLDEEYLSRLIRIDRDALDYQEQLSYDMFKLLRELSLESKLYPSHLQPVNQFYLMTNTFVRLGSGASSHPFETVKDYDDFLSRTDDFVVNVDHAIENMKEGMRKGIVQPRILMEKVIPQLESQLVDNVEESAFWRPIEEMPASISAAERERLEDAYRASITEKVWPAFERLRNFIKDDYLEAARETVGLGDLPGGDDWYRYLVRYRTTIDLSPDEIHQIGLDEVERIHDEMRHVMLEVGFEGDLKAFFEFVNSDEQFYFDEPDDLIQGYRDMSARIEALSKKLFDIAPKTAFEVRRVEPFREASASGGSYVAGTPDGSRPGIFYANAYDIKARPKWAMESLFLHEAIPGHHFQIALQQENEALPRFRRFARFTAYSEGWGLYAESLGKEIGVYTDPYQYFGALNAELWRAIRLVVDTGLHAKGWTRQDVLDYMYANSAVKPARAISEAERFMAIPGQALAYKVGQLKILAIRADAERRL